MKVVGLEVHNYRNLDGITLSFHDDCNFLVGENNLGKSNILALLNTLFSRRAFQEDDFFDITKPIQVILKLKLANVEIGHFQDLFTATDYHLIALTCLQSNPDGDIEFLHTETGTNIPPGVIRQIHFVYYNSLRNPITEINFDKTRGVGRFLTNLISAYLKNTGFTDKDFLDGTKVQALITALNANISRIKSFNDFGIAAAADDDPESLLTKVVVLKDAKGEALSRAGYGIQFLILVTLSVLERIQTICQERRDSGIFQDEQTGKKAISLVLGLDEPEIHLHPYMQRSLLKYLNEVINNKNTQFSALIKDLFGIDYFVGQILVVTHSPNVLLEDYRQIIRLYSEKGKVKVISGLLLKLDRQQEKHLLLNFPFIKEAFFSRSAIFVEGDSEYSSIPIFTKTTTGNDLDDLGICVIKANGSAVPLLLVIAGLFGIPSVGLTDKDDGSKPPTMPNHYETTKRNFEDEFVSMLLDSGRESVLRQVLTSYDPQGVNRTLDPKALNNTALHKFGAITTPYQANLKLAAIQTTNLLDLRAFYLTWFTINKSYPLGRHLGQTLSADQIPTPYKDIIAEALRLVQNV